MQLLQYDDHDMTNYSSVADTDSLSLYYLHSSIKRFTEEVIEQATSEQADESNDDDGFGLTSSEQTLNAWVPRVGGVITCLCALCMLIMAWKRRNGLFHRLVLGMSIHLFVKGIFSMIGMAAIPIGEINAIGNVGNITTCSIQGFVIYVCSMTALFYYCSFSIYSFVGILNNFDFTRNKNKIGWIEKYIHVLVHIYPIGSALYLLSKQSFNAHTYGFCFIGSAPMGCVYDDDDIPCERGPTTYDELKQFYLLFWMGPLVVQLIFPTTVMVLLYYMIKQRQDKIFMNAAIFRKQAMIYLFALYWTILPFLVVAVLVSTAPNEKDMMLSVFASAHLNFSLFALWAMLSYFFFSFTKKSTNLPSSKTTNTNATDNGNTDTSTTNMTTTPVENSATNDVPTNTEQRKSSNFLFSSEEFIIEEPPPSTTTTVPHEQQQRRLEIYSFNIFDGTNASSAFAEFVHEGDSDDENDDNEETERWAAVQDHI